MIEVLESEPECLQVDNICHSPSSTEELVDHEEEFSYQSNNDNDAMLEDVQDASNIHNADSTCEIEDKPAGIDTEHCSVETLSPSSSTKIKPNYHRRPKPPFSYIALIAMAIKDTPCGKLTLAEINEYLIKRFPFFRGSYTGWRNSVRHNLSLNECFVKILRDPSRPWGKDNYWTINENSEYTFADGVFRRRRKRIHRTDKNIPSKSDLVRYRYPSESKKKFTGPFSIDNILGNTGNEDTDGNKTDTGYRYNSQKTHSDISLHGRNYTVFSAKDIQQYSVKSSEPEISEMRRTIPFPVFTPSSSVVKGSNGFHNSLTSQRFEVEHFQSRGKPEMSMMSFNFCPLTRIPLDLPSDGQRETVSMPLIRLPFYLEPSVKRSTYGSSCFSVESIIS